MGYIWFATNIQDVEVNFSVFRPQFSSKSFQVCYKIQACCNVHLFQEWFPSHQRECQICSVENIDVRPNALQCVQYCIWPLGHPYDIFPLFVYCSCYFHPFCYNELNVCRNIQGFANNIITFCSFF